MKKFPFFILFLSFSFCLLIFSFLYPNPYTLHPISAQVQTGCATSTTPRVGGLVTTPSLDASSKFYTSTGNCIVSSQTPFVPYKIPTYDDLKSQYFTQSKLTHNTTFPASFSTDGIYNLAGPFILTSNLISGNGTEVIFVDGDLTINGNIIYHTSDRSGGLVFVVSGNIIIPAAVTQIDAILIAQGIIYTAGNGCSSSLVTASQLVINGSFVSLDSTKPIKFCRALSNNSTAAEVINHQPKYLVILRNLFSQTLQKWSEVTGPITIPSAPPSTPTPAPTPTPTPTPNPTPTPAPACTAVTIGPSVTIGPALCI